MKRLLQLCFGLLLIYVAVIGAGYLVMDRAIKARFGNKAVMYVYEDLGYVPSRKNLRTPVRCSDSLFSIKLHELLPRALFNAGHIVTWYGEGSIVPFHFGVYADQGGPLLELQEAGFLAA